MGSGAGKGEGKGAGKGKGKGEGKKKGGKSAGKGKSKSSEDIKKKKKKKQQREGEGGFDDEYNMESGSGRNKNKKQQNKNDEDGSAGSQHIFLKVIMVLQVLLIIGAANMIVVQFVGGLDDEKIEIIPAASRIYVVLFSSLVVLNEAGLGDKLLGGSAFFTNWLFRGFFYSYIGVVGLEQNSLASKDVGLYATVTAWYMLIGGMIYAGMGIFCLQKLYNKLKTGGDGDEGEDIDAEESDADF